MSTKLFRQLGIFQRRTSRKGEVYYVSGTGSDLNSGLHPLRAWRSIQKLNNNRNRISPQDFVLFQRGYEYPGIPFYLTRGEKPKVGAFGRGPMPRFPDVDCS
ncbi:MAG: hypothetical protein OEM26_01385 [Saprospiraceae bacterium]|nr:hypothetical protein [Saprospiraceae bacterium]